MSRKRKNLNKKDLLTILELIKRQRYLSITPDKELDPEGFIPFTNEVACRNIKENIYKYLQSVLEEDSIPYEASPYDELSNQGIKKYKKENNNDNRRGFIICGNKLYKQIIH